MERSSSSSSSSKKNNNNNDIMSHPPAKTKPKKNETGNGSVQHQNNTTDNHVAMSKLSNEQLSEALKSYNIVHGPITKTTRMLYETKLRKCLESLTKSSKNDDTDGGDSERKEEYGEKNEYYFSVQLPPSAQKNGKHIFKDKTEALKFCKENRDARFKVFQDLKSAESFCGDVFKAKIYNEIRGKENCTKATLQENLASESSIHPNPKPPELISFRRAIEDGDVETVKEMVKSNPRFLIGGGDKPTILQEGCRYNALHVCCKSNQLEVCKYLIDELMCVSLYEKMYPDDKWESRSMRMMFMLDYYLNNREKGVLETPLHVASKYGHLGIIEFLLSLPSVDKYLRNKENLTPLQVACSRASNSASKDLKKKIESVFEDWYYVYVSRAMDNSEPPRLSLPFCPNLFSKDWKEITFPWSPTRNYISDLCEVDNKISPMYIKSLLDSPNVEEWKAFLFHRSPPITSKKGTTYNRVIQSAPRKLMKGEDDYDDDDYDGDDYHLDKLINNKNRGLTTKRQSKCQKKLPLECNPSTTASSPMKSINQLICNSTFSFSDTTPIKPSNQPKVPVVIRTPDNKQLIKFMSDIRTTPRILKSSSQSQFKSISKTQKSTNNDMANDTPNSYWTKAIMPNIFSATDSLRAIRGVAGPMSLKKCNWQGPSCVSAGTASLNAQLFRSQVTNNNIKGHDRQMLSNIKRTDSSKGLERVCRLVAKELNVEWREHWDFLDTCIDLTSNEGLVLFNDYLQSNVNLFTDLQDGVQMNSYDDDDEDGGGGGDDSLVEAMRSLKIKSPFMNKGPTKETQPCPPRNKTKDTKATSCHDNLKSGNSVGDDYDDEESEVYHNQKTAPTEDDDNDDDDNDDDDNDGDDGDYIINHRLSCSDTSIENTDGTAECRDHGDDDVINGKNSKATSNDVKSCAYDDDDKTDGEVKVEKQNDQLNDVSSVNCEKLGATNDKTDDDQPSSSTQQQTTKQNNDDDPPSSSTQQQTKPNNDDDQPSSSTHQQTTKQNNDDDQLSSSLQQQTTTKANDDDPLSSSTHQQTTTKPDDDDDQPSSSLQQQTTTKLNDDDNDQLSSSTHQQTTTKANDDDDPLSSSTQQQTTTKPNDDDDDDDDECYHTPRESEEEEEEEEEYSDTVSVLQNNDECHNINDDADVVNHAGKLCNNKTSHVEPPGTFIYGDLPTRSDLDAYYALEGHQYELSSYPLVLQWYLSVQPYSDHQMTRWLDIDRLSRSLATPSMGVTMTTTPQLQQIKYHQEDKIVYQSLQISRNKVTLLKDAVVRNLSMTFNEASDVQ